MVKKEKCILNQCYNDVPSDKNTVFYTHEHTKQNILSITYIYMPGFSLNTCK